MSESSYKDSYEYSQDDSDGSKSLESESIIMTTNRLESARKNNLFPQASENITPGSDLQKKTKPDNSNPPSLLSKISVPISHLALNKQSKNTESSSTSESSNRAHLSKFPNNNTNKINQINEEGTSNYFASNQSIIKNKHNPNPNEKIPLLATTQIIYPQYHNFNKPNSSAKKTPNKNTQQNIDLPQPSLAGPSIKKEENKIENNDLSSVITSNQKYLSKKMVKSEVEIEKIGKKRSSSHITTQETNFNKTYADLTNQLKAERFFTGKDKERIINPYYNLPAKPQAPIIKINILQQIDTLNDLITKEIIPNLNINKYLLSKPEIEKKIQQLNKEDSKYLKIITDNLLMIINCSLCHNYNAIIELTCKHIFCKKCSTTKLIFKEKLKKNHSEYQFCCPICKKKLKLWEIDMIFPKESYDAITEKNNLEKM